MKTKTLLVIIAVCAVVVALAVATVAAVFIIPKFAEESQVAAPKLAQAAKGAANEASLAARRETLRASALKEVEKVLLEDDSTGRVISTREISMAEALDYFRPRVSQSSLGKFEYGMKMASSQHPSFIFMQKVRFQGRETNSFTFIYWVEDRWAYLLPEQ